MVFARTTASYNPGRKRRGVLRAMDVEMRVTSAMSRMTARSEMRLHCSTYMSSAIFD